MGATISEIAKLANVSTATVSRTFSQTGYVSKENREAILKIAEQLNYKPKKYKKSNTSKAFNNVIAVVGPDVYNTFFRDVIRGIESVTYEKGYDVLVCDTNEDVGKEIRCLSALRAKKIGGLIISVVSDIEEYNAECLENMNRSGIPVVLIDRDIRSSNLDGVFLDDYRGVFKAVQALIDNDHRNIAIVCGSTTSRTGTERLNGYLSALRTNGIPVNESLILYGEYREDLAYSLTENLLSTQPDVTAIIACNSIMAGGCLQAIKDMKLKIPDDIAFISYGKKDYFEQTDNNISYVSRPVFAVGEECATILLEKIRTGKRSRPIPKKNTVFPIELILKGSEVYPKNRRKKAVSYIKTV